MLKTGNVIPFRAAIPQNEVSKIASQAINNGYKTGKSALGAVEGFIKGIKDKTLTKVGEIIYKGVKKFTGTKVKTAFMEVKGFTIKALTAVKNSTPAQRGLAAAGICLIAAGIVAANKIIHKNKKVSE